MQRQFSKLEKLGQAFDRVPPKWVVAMLMWDETSERIQVPAIQGSTPAQQSSTYEVLVAKATLSWGFDNDGRVFHTEFILPPVPLTSNKAEHIYAGLFHHHFNCKVQALIKSTLRKATLAAAELHETDGHPANDRLHYHLLNSEVASSKEECRHPVMNEQVHCWNHTTNLVIVHLMNVVIGVAVLNNLYCLVMFLRMGGHFLRVVACAYKLVRSPYFRWNESSGPDLEAGEPFCRELGNMLIDNYRRSNTKYDTIYKYTV